MLPPDGSPMDFLHPPMLPQEEENLFNQYLHPPMVPIEWYFVVDTDFAKIFN